MIRKIALSVFAACMVALPAHADEPPVVVELFTSQGCIACPPADVVLNELAEDDSILALSWAVDYWDYLGWKDTFGSAQNTVRQEYYNREFGQKGVYTPQMIINGRHQVIGSRKKDVLALVERARAEQDLARVSLSGDRTHLEVLIEGEAPRGKAVVRVIWYKSEEIVYIRNGDNRGKSLRYSNVVRGSDIMGQWDGNKVILPIDLGPIIASGADCVAIIVQDGEYGPILGAAKLALDPVI
ncbi:MAG: DUF1223 domain-containing protein [Proteobacteria bacterium]|nr:DUF1223 domain-containing protein [Pseudomonadota bacterium]